MTPYVPFLFIFEGEIKMDIKDKYINFFVSKGHKQIPSAPVVPENDPSANQQQM